MRSNWSCELHYTCIYLYILRIPTEELVDIHLCKGKLNVQINPGRLLTLC
jgi:hypothetical protein